MFGFGYTGIIASMKKLPSGGGYGALTTAYSTATGITDVTQLTAWNNWETYINANGIVGKYKQVLMLHSGTSATAVIDFMGFANATVYGGYTFSTSGATGDGSSGYMKSGVLLNQLTQGNMHFSFYSRTNSLALSCEVAQPSSGGMLFQFNGGTSNSSISNGNGPYSLTLDCVQTDSLGLFTQSKGANGDDDLFKNLTKQGTDTFINEPSPTSNDIYFSQLYPYNIRFSARQIAMRTLGSDFTDAELILHRTGIHNLMTELGLNV